jgi:hypothetical protein
MTEVFRLGVTDNNTYAYLQDIKIPERWQGWEMTNNNKKEYICQLYAKCQTPMGLGCIKQTS